MSAKQPSFVGSASFAPCPNCNEGALTWDPTKAESTCMVCD
ncbi:hypothetical protein [Natronomonas halophila]|nr:hypothetical protein [Natronomonas halophila]